MHIVGQYIGCNQWQQINYYFYCTAPREEDNKDFQNTFKRIWDLSEHLHLCCREFYQPGINFTVDKIIEGFTGRTPEIVNIPTKPTPEGFKIWALSNQGYILDWMFYAKSSKGGPYNLNPHWHQNKGFSKTQAVVLNFLTQQDNITELRIGGAGTIQTTKTKCEEQEEAKEQKTVLNLGTNLLLIKQINSSLADLKLIHNS